MTQKKYILSLLKKNKNAVVIGSLGTISNDLEELGGQGNELRLVRGAMGCVLGIGLGMAMSSRRNIIVLIGEGSFLMKLGSITTINRYKPKNLKVIILNNGKYILENLSIPLKVVSQNSLDPSKNIKKFKPQAIASGDGWEDVELKAIK